MRLEADTDIHERSIGIYENNRKAATLRVLNPFFCLARILDYVAEFPSRARFAWLLSFVFKNKKPCQEAV